MQNLYRVEALPPTIAIGVQTEEGVCAIDFDCSAWLESWPDLSLSAVHTRPGEMASYPVETEMDGAVLRWTVGAVDTEIAGQGVIEIIGVSNGKRKLSGKTCTHIEETSTIETTEAPTVMQSYIEQVQAAVNRAEAAADAAEEALENQATVEDVLAALPTWNGGEY